MAEEIWKRHTNRKFYKKKAAPASVITAMHESITRFPGADLHVITQPDKLKQLAAVVYQTDRIRTEFRPLHEHLMQMIRFTDQEVALTRDGLPLKNLEAGFSGEQFLKLTRPWPVMNVMNKTGIGRMVALHSYQGIVNASGASLLTMDGVEPHDFLYGGRALQRIWLTLTQMGVQMQPMTAVTLFLQRMRLGMQSSFLPRHQQIIEKIEPGYRDLFELDQEQSQIMLFRFGYADEIECRTLRKLYRQKLRTG